MPLAGLVSILVVLIIVGLALWILGQIPMDDTHRIIKVVILVVVCIYLLYWLLGFLPAGGLYLPHRG